MRAILLTTFTCIPFDRSHSGGSTVGNDGMYLDSPSLPTLTLKRYAAAAAMLDISRYLVVP